MKVFTYIFIIASIALIIFNITLLDFDNLMEGDSVIALISIAAVACGIVLMLILSQAKKIVQKEKELRRNQ